MTVLFYLILFIICIWAFIKILKMLPFFLRFLILMIITSPIWIVLIIFVPGIIDEGVLFLLIILFASIKSIGSESYSSYDSFGSYILNKKSGVIHNSWDDSADTISEHNKKTISSSEAHELVSRGTKYRFKKD